ncbi:MAG: lipocalin family protein [Robiginitalea sp.]|uniref:lipocalin family protein n=1 Tax=Robiginitalea sp. TaxID=1902411 RepID=UPI003C790BB7
MKLKSFLSGLFIVLLLSCSSDDDGDSGSNSIVGSWDAVSLQLDSGSQEEQSLVDFFNLLAAQECYLISMILEADNEATLLTSIDYLDLSGLFTGNLSIDCPTESDSETATYSFENDQLRITDSNGITTSVDANLNGDRLTLFIEGEEFDDLEVSGSLIFERR